VLRLRLSFLVLFDLPSHETLYLALMDQNSDNDGQAFVGVATAGFFVD
jgi:methylphosphotriester-DNA--protein-cysteine methyltransferase